MKYVSFENRLIIIPEIELIEHPNKYSCGKIVVIEKKRIINASPRRKLERGGLWKIE